MKLRLNFQIFVSHVILSKNLLNETKKMTQHRKRWKSHRQHATKLFSILRLSLFSVTNTFEERLYNDDV